MPYSPLISKIRVHNPNKKGSSNANRNYATYIATREGVSLEKVNNVDDLLNIEGMEQRIGAEAIVHEEADNEQYLRYISKRTRSQGLFGNINTDDLTKVSSDIAKLTKSGRIIFRGVISLSEKDGEELGFRNVNAWNNYLKEVMPDVAQKLGISSVDHTWVAAFHAEEKHPHVHYMLWDNKDRVKSPFIHKVTQQKIRIFLEERVFNNEYEKVINQVYKEELKVIYKEKNKERAYLPDKAAELMKEIGYVPGAEYERLPQRVPKGYLEEVAKEVEQLIKMVPERGGIEYGYLPQEGKEQLEKVVDKLFERPDMESSLERYLDAVKQIGKYKGRTKTKIARAIDREKNEVRKRIGNRILDELKAVVFVDDKEKAEVFDEKNADMLHKTLENDSMDAFAVNSSVDDVLEYEAVSTDKIMAEEMKSFEKGSDQDHEIELADIIPDEETTFFGRMNEFEYEIVDIDPDIVTNPDTEVGIEQEKKYFIEWNEEYKSAMGMIYDEENDIKSAFELLENQSIKGNVLAIAEKAKIIERGLSELSSEKAVEHYNETFKAFNEVYHEAKKDYIKSYSAYRIGKLLDQGKGDLEADYENAAEWYKKAGDNKYAQYSLAKLYLAEKIYESEDKDLLQNQKAAFILMKGSADRGNPFAAYEVGNMYLKAIYVDYDKQHSDEYYKNAMIEFVSMAKNSIDDSLFYRIGKMYLDGLGTEMDPEKGEQYIKKAADLGNEIAKIKLASIFFDKEDLESKKDAIRILIELSNDENKMAQYKLGTIYCNEQSEFYYFCSGYNYFLSSAEQGNQFAQYRIGAIHADKENPEYYDIAKAIYFLEQSEVQKNEFARYRLGCIYANKEHQEFYNLEKAIGYLKLSAEQGNQYAQYKLGCIYGDREQPEYYDLKKAIGYWEASASQENQYAQYKLGCIYGDREQLVLYDLEKAIGYLEESAEQENQFAQYKLGCIYVNREDPEYYDLKKAIGYLEDSAEQENQFAQYKLGCIYEDREQPEYYDIEKAICYLEDSAGQGNQYAQYKLGCIYADPQSPYIDMEKGIKYLNEAAEQGNQFAQYKLGKIYANPDLVYYNLNRAIEYLNKSAQQENQFAQYELGKFYADKVSPFYNIDVAIRNFTLAAEQGNEYAQCRLGCIYYFGKDVLRDKDLGRYWLECSATQGNEYAKSVLEDQIVGMDFSYCLLKGALNSMETMNRQMDFSKNEVMEKTQSKQALKEKYLHQHKDQEE